MSRRAGLWALAGLLALGCSGLTVPPERWQLTDGRTLGELSSDTAPTAMLVVDPAECFRCLGIVAPWLEARRGGAGASPCCAILPPVCVPEDPCDPDDPSG